MCTMHVYLSTAWEGLMHEVNVTKRVIVNGQWLFCPVVRGKNDRIKPNTVLVGKGEGQERTLEEQYHSEGRYYIDYREGGKRCRRAAGKDATEADDLRRRQELILAAKGNGVRVLDETKPPAGRVLQDAVDTYQIGRASCRERV